MNVFRWRLLRILEQTLMGLIISFVKRAIALLKPSPGLNFCLALASLSSRFRLLFRLAAILIGITVTKRLNWFSNFHCLPDSAFF